METWVVVIGRMGARRTAHSLFAHVDDQVFVDKIRQHHRCLKDRLGTKASGTGTGAGVYGIGGGEGEEGGEREGEREGGGEERGGKRG